MTSTYQRLIEKREKRVIDIHEHTGLIKAYLYEMLDDKYCINL